MKLQRILTLLLAGLLALSFAACGDGDSAGSAGSAWSGQSSSSQSSTSNSESSDRAGLTLRVGMDGKFTDYPWEYTGELNDAGVVPPAETIAALGELTGWDLSLADEVTNGKGGMTVTFAKSCAIFTGPPEQQKEAFHMYSADQLAATVLDSIRQTLNTNYGGTEGLDVYFCGPDGGDLVLENLGVTISSTQPYTAFPSPEETGGTVQSALEEKVKDEDHTSESDYQSPAPELGSISHSVYIGRQSNYFDTYDLVYDGPLTDAGVIPPKELIDEIAALTGWNLSLGDQVYDGKGGMTVTFGADCVLFTGPPEVQNEAFHVYSAEELAETVLDSIRQTLVMNYGGAEGLDVWFCGPDGGDLVLDNIGVTISCLEPYTAFPG
ncbi:MAG: hypothetical protein HFE94_00670 [Acutalibacter sp.]|nr:hypothetical protein [Acutalibacter sp.]